MSTPLALLPQLLPTSASGKGELVLGTFHWSRIDWLGIALNWGMAILILLLGIWFARWISGVFERALVRARVELTLAKFLRNVCYALVVVLVVITALQKIGVPPTSLAAVIGAAGLGVGLALKDSLSNIASGVMLIVLRPISDGDHVVIADMEGKVSEIRIFQTYLHTFDQRVIVVPNSTVTANPIINYSRLPTRRISIPVGVGYDDDLKQAKQVLLQIAAEHASVLKEPAPWVAVDALSDSSVDLILYAYTLNADYPTTRSDLLQAVHDRLLEHGLSIPFPQRDLHVYHHDAPAAAGRASPASS